MANDVLHVSYKDNLVGYLKNMENTNFTFSYDNKWLIQKGAFPLSVLLPLQKEPFSKERSNIFFSNLLPEGTVRQQIVRQLGISEDNDFHLLKAIGGECAGAISVTPEFPANKRASYYKKLSKNELIKLITQQNALSEINNIRQIRLSLAGAQNKLPVYWKKNKIHVPVGNLASSHILKFPNQQFKHLPANEVFVIQLGRKIGLNAVISTLLTELKTPPLCIVERYDRRIRSNGKVERLHQEDFCQALGYFFNQKYEGEGGPSFKQCFQLVIQHSDEPLLDGQALIDWHIFNYIVGNADGHGKNLSLYFNPDGNIRLAPFYDLVCTYVYRQLTKQMAMSIGGCSVPGQLTKKHWIELAEKIEVTQKYLVSRVFKLTTRAKELLPMHTKEFENQYGKQPAVQMVTSQILKNVRVIRRSI